MNKSVRRSSIGSFYHTDMRYQQLLFKLRNHKDIPEYETYSMAKELAEEALKTLRSANEHRNRPHEADDLAKTWLRLLKER